MLKPRRLFGARRFMQRVVSDAQDIADGTSCTRQPEIERDMNCLCAALIAVCAIGLALLLSVPQ